jgi:hypothetical protein
MRRFIQQAKSKGATVIVCSSIPKNDWKDAKLKRGELGFAAWALEVAKDENVATIDLNNMIADVYDKEGEKAVTEKYHIKTGHVHTTTEGAILNASIVAEGIKQLKKCSLKNFLVTQ